MKRRCLALVAVALLGGCYSQAPIIVTVPARTHLDENGNTVTEQPNVVVVMPQPPQQVVVPYYYPYYPYRPFVYPFYPYRW